MNGAARTEVMRAAVMTCAVLTLVGASSWRLVGVRAALAQVTWRQQVAPLVYAHCTGCHHAGGSGPFPLMTYEDARRRGSLMKTVTQSRYMPPWLPEPGHGDFEGNRRLSDDEIALLKAWVEGGMPEGAGNAPAAPVYSGDWQLGPPDLVLEMPKPLRVPASGTDLFENFILPTSLAVTKWVRAMEIKPGSPQVVHHANVLLDRTASLRRANPTAWQEGIPGMDIMVDSGENFDPDSHFLFWKPDSTALIEPAAMPWRLDAGDDLVLNMHLKPTGKEENIRARIGLYFADKPATEHPMLLQLEHDAALNIPPGDPAFVVEDSLTLPVAVDVLGVYPHAHYLGKRMEGWATLPNGERRWLVLIKDWDIDRQSVYRFARPVALPKGSVIHMRYTYDNSAGNVRNPNSPPIRVRDGNRSVDEMGHLWLQVLPRAEAGSDPRMKLQRAWMESRLQKDGHDDIALYNLASLSMAEGESARAAELYRRALEQRPGDVRMMTSLGSALEASGDWQAAQAQYRAAMAKDPGYADAVFDLATVDLGHEAVPEAEAMFRRLLAEHPGDAGAQAGLGDALWASGRTAEAKAEFERVLAAAPVNFEALIGLGRMEAEGGSPEAAESLLLRAIAVRNDAEAQRSLAMVYATSGALARALDHLEAWQQLAPNDPEPHRALAQVYSQIGRKSDAIWEQRRVIALAPQSAGDWNDLGVMEAQAGDLARARQDLQHALQIEPGNQAVQANLRRF